MERVIGLGGPFVKAKDPKTLAAWYEKHLGIPFNGGTYAMWMFKNSDGTEKEGFNIMSFSKQESDYFAPSQKEVMINFVVKDLFGLLEQLKQEGITVVGDAQDTEYGKFGWIMDPEGNKVELWQP